MMKVETLQRQILKAKANIADLEEKKDYLSQHGHWSLGYWKGRLSVLEDWLDELLERP